MSHLDPTPQLGQTAPTQTVHPMRASIRTGIQALVGLLLVLPLLPPAAFSAWPWLLPVVPIAAAVARVLAIPAVETYLKRWLPWLSAQPPLSHQDGSAFGTER